jgi:murein DD-endopeptidase MepM/ murein hydrolase activator NlpD
MGDATIGTTPGSAAPAAPDTQEAGEALRQRVKLMAQQFEAMLMTQMLRDMRQSMLSDEEDEKGLGKDTMTDTMDIELGGLLSRAGGIGLANALSKAMDQRLGVSAPAASTTPLPNGIVPVTQPLANEVPRAVKSGGADPGSTSADPGSLQVPHGRVSSAYGWRSDPFNGAQRFHNGIDVAQAYGQDVRAAAGGRVTFSGDRGSYGTTVIVEHPGGRQTLYAHLSAIDVRPGDVVDPGQVIGKSGSSGHSTGPHLHFEVLDGGHPVDPSRT